MNRPLLILLLTALPALAESTNRLVWPPPPEPPRIEFVQTATGSPDFGISRSVWSRVVEFFTGANQRDLFVRPCGVAVTGNGTLLVTDTGLNVVYAFDLTRHRLNRWDKAGKYRFASPVAIVQHGDTIFVADSALRAVLGFDSKGKLRVAITNGLERPAGLVITDDKLFVADAGRHQIAVFDLAGKPVTHFGQRGTAPGQFNFPTHLAADGKGLLFVTDSMNARIQILTTAGEPRGVIGSIGDGTGHFSKPKGIALDGPGNIYVADAAFDNVQIFNQAGALLLHFGNAGAKAGEFWLPAGIAIDHDNRIYVADSYNHRLQVFRYVGAP